MGLLLWPSPNNVTTAVTIRWERLTSCVLAAAAHDRTGRRPIVRCTLAALTVKLGPSFIRVHRSHVVPLERVRALRTSRNRREVLLADGSTVPLGRRYAALAEQRLSGAPSGQAHALAVDSIIGGLEQRVD